MLDVVYRFGRLFLSRGWIAGLVLIVATASIGTVGFSNENDLSNKNYSRADAVYKAVDLLILQLDLQPSVGNWQLELARWLGMLFFASALITFAIRLSREAVHRLLVNLLAKDHIIVAGLGVHGVRLVEALLTKRRTVVIIEADRLHPSIDPCRRLGAIVLFGDPTVAKMLLAAQLPRASAILALFREESDCVRITTAAYEVLHSEKASPKKPPVRCVLRLTEPGLLDVVRRHKLKTDPTDRIQLEILNSHEIAATTMVREARANARASFRKLLVLGLGTHHRLGELVILRAVKDHLILSDGQPGEKLDIEVFDKHAGDWLGAFRSRFPFLDKLCTIRPHPCWARKVGGTGIDRDYDAAFVCIPDEGHATAQAVMLRREVLTDGQPIMVRVTNSRSGYGGLIATPGSGWGENLTRSGWKTRSSMPTRPRNPNWNCAPKPSTKTIGRDRRTARNPRTSRGYYWTIHSGRQIGNWPSDTPPTWPRPTASSRPRGTTGSFAPTASRRSIRMAPCCSSSAPTNWSRWPDASIAYGRKNAKPPAGGTVRSKTSEPRPTRCWWITPN